MKILNRNVVGIYESLEYCGLIRGSSTFQYKTQDQEGVSKARKKRHVYFQAQFGGQPTCANQELQRTGEDVKNPLQRSQDEEFVQYHFHWPQDFHVQDDRRR